MGTTWVITCEFTSPVHLGEPGIGLERCGEHCPSDTLFSGLANAWALAFGRTDLEGLLAAFRDGNPPFRLSSAFPFSTEANEGKSRRVFYLPRPAIRPWPGEDRPPPWAQLKKEVRFVEVTLFRKWLDRQLVDQEHYDAIRGKPYERASKEQLLPRLRLDRVEGRSQLYFVGLRHFREGAGLYCFLDLKQPELEPKVRAAFEFLGERGLGGERAIGCGRFQPKFVTPEEAGLQEVLARPKSPSRYCLLSLSAPSQEEWKGIRAENLEGYRLVERGGFADSPFLTKPIDRKRCWMFAEGSVFKQEPTGMLLDVAPSSGAPHPIYRYGLAFAIAV